MIPPYYYAVKVGRDPGIYENWRDSLAQVHGYSGGQQKKFDTIEEARGYLHGYMPELDVYVDGGCRFNGTCYARAGWGVFYDNLGLRHLNEGGRLGGPIQTSNRAELFAMIRACRLAPPSFHLRIHSDSEYVINCMNRFQWRWRKNGWTTQRGTPVQNRDLIEILDDLIDERGRRPELIKVSAHSGIRGNELADKWAKEGADDDD